MIEISKLNRIALGIQGENNANAFSVDISEWLSEFPNGSISVKVLRPTESVPYLAAVTVDGSALNWVITASDTGIAGEGQAEIQLTDDDVVKKARVVPTVVLPCLDGTAEPTPPPAEQPWIDQVAGYRDEVIAVKEEIEAQNYVKSVNGIEAGDNGNAKVTAANIDYTPEQTVGDAIAEAQINIENSQLRIDTISSIATDIDRKIPDEASATNKLADKAFVGDSINSVTAYYITKNANGDQFATKAELDSTRETEFYSGGQIRYPVTRNDYCIVLADESKINPITHVAPTTRYIFNNGWEYQYTVNETALTEEQMTAINSGISAQKVAKYDGYDNGKQDTLTDAQLSAVNSGITADKVAQYDGQTTQVVYYYRSGKEHLYKDANLTAQATFSEVKANLDDRTKFVYVEDLNENDYHECLIPTHLSASVIYFVRTTLTASGDFKIYKLQLNANGTVVETEQTAQQKLTAGNNITIEGNVISASGGGAPSGYELIETITFNGTASLVRSADAQRNPYNFKSCYVEFTCPALSGATTANVTISFKVGSKNVACAMTGAVQAAKKNSAALCHNLGGVYLGIGRPNTTGDFGASTQNIQCSMAFSSDPITQLTFTVNTAVITAGSTAKIYAIK